MNTAIDRPRALLGAALVLVGGLYLLSNFGIVHGLDVWGLVWGAFWLWLGAVVVGPRGRGVGAARLTLGLVLIVAGVVTLADGLGVIDFSFGFLVSRFWPLILIGLGALILYESNRTRAAGAASERIEHDSIFGDFKLTQPGWQLRDVRASTVIGDTKIDLNRARIPAGETVIDLRAVIGDIDIWTPPDLPVALDVQCVFVTIDYYGFKQDVMLRRYTNVSSGFESAPRRVRVHANLIFGDINLTRAG
jgi:predicted membrane protein